MYLSLLGCYLIYRCIATIVYVIVSDNVGGEIYLGLIIILLIATLHLVHFLFTNLNKKFHIVQK